MPVAQPNRERTLDPDAAAHHLPRLYGLARSLCDSRQLAEELTQETYVRVLSRPRRLRGDSDFHYLARTLRNLVSDHWRSERRRPACVADWHLAEEPATVGDPELAALAGELYAALGGLPDHLRLVVAAVDVAGLSYSEAAELLRIPDGTVMSRLSRARARLACAVA